jgi:transcriptional regulator of acetoin/glycerol metabolism
LFAAVLHGVFAETLYYRLNGVLIDITLEALRAVVNESEDLQDASDARDGGFVRQSA